MWIEPGVPVLVVSSSSGIGAAAGSEARREIVVHSDASGSMLAGVRCRDLLEKLSLTVSYKVPI